VIAIDGPWWFAGALLICGVHLLYLRGWRRERREYVTWRETYNAAEQERHDALMQVIGRDANVAHGWNLDGSRERGRA
jgi:hypothetical protein